MIQVYVLQKSYLMLDTNSTNSEQSLIWGGVEFQRNIFHKKVLKGS